jgi:hypothetical protein
MKQESISPCSIPDFLPRHRIDYPIRYVNKQCGHRFEIFGCVSLLPKLFVHPVICKELELLI